MFVTPFFRKKINLFHCFLAVPFGGTCPFNIFAVLQAVFVRIYPVAPAIIIIINYPGFLNPILCFKVVCDFILISDLILYHMTNFNLTEAKPDTKIK